MPALKKKKKSTTKSKRPDTSSIIPIIAIIEVIILIAVSSYAWFYFSVDNSLTSGIITVQADSGLEIDFSEADDKTKYIDIWQYLDQKNFRLEPASSVDGRNIFFPTSGTFGNTNTELMAFREGTVNDINSKYISIDFELSNTTNSEMQVYLSDKSEFTITEDDKVVNGKALRLAFYNNDGNSGYVSPNMLETITSSGSESSSTPDPDEFTVYFYIPQKGFQPKVYITDDPSNDATAATYEYEEDSLDTYTLTSEEIAANNSGAMSSIPGIAMSYVSGDVYSYTFSNPYKSITREVVVEGETVVKKYVSTQRMYDTVRFNNGYTSWQTDSFELADEHIYSFGMSASSNADGDEISFKTVYFLKPDDWTTPRCIPYYTNHAQDETGYYDDADKGNRKLMNEVTTGIYSFTFPTFYDKISFLENKDTGAGNSVQVDAVDGKLYYFPDPDSTDIRAEAGQGGPLRTVTYSESMIFFYNTAGWDTPYAFANAFPKLDDYTYSIPMISLSGNLYYCKLPSVYVSDIIGQDTTDVTGASPACKVRDFANNCTVYFGNKSADPTEKTSLTYADSSNVLCKDEYVYSPSLVSPSVSGGITTYAMETAQKFEGGNRSTSYAVISPGVSRDFQRSANPVKEINTISGAATAIVPAFASSFDDYIMGSGRPVFTIASQQTVHMSMILWLEGTDAHCTGENYAGKNIKLYLEFATQHAGDIPENTYTYYFVDKTEQHWTGNTQPNAAGIDISPVMQLYDETVDRGYKMTEASPTSYAGENKIGMWKCVAPQTLASQGHKLQFRRVNPYDETEVWNRWEAGELYNYRSVALNPSTRSVYFTAFADGSPEYSVYDKGTDARFDVPELSCGGLWGYHDTEILTVYDGRQNRTLENNNGALSIRYTYTYPSESGGTPLTADIEYVASNYRDLHQSSETYFNAFYSFVVPKDIYTRALNPQFKNYKNVKPKTAINAASNQNITLANVWFAGSTVNGSFFEINEEGSNAPDNAAHTAAGSNYHSYWGSDVIYIQSREPLKNDFDGGFKQAHFVTSSGDPVYSYLYRNDNYNVDHSMENLSTYGYVAVVPSDIASSSRVFTGYRIEKVNPSKHHQIFETTDTISLYPMTDPRYTGYATGNTAVSANNYVSNSRVLLDYYLWKIWFCNDTGNTVFDSVEVQTRENAYSADQFGRDIRESMHFESTEEGKNYYYCLVPQVGQFRFIVNNDNYTDWWYLSPEQGLCFKPSSSTISNNHFSIQQIAKRAGIDRDNGEKSISYRCLPISSDATVGGDDNSIQYWPRYIPQ